MISLNKLVDIYNSWGDKQKLSPLGSADEELYWNSKLHKSQCDWLERFIKVWDLTQENERKNNGKILKKY
jgi:hypothetical protein